MTILPFPQKQKDAIFFKDILNDGYHIFSRKNVKRLNYYPDEIPTDEMGVKITDLKVGDTIIVRVFFRIEDDGEEIQAEGGYLDLMVEGITDKAASAVIFTKLPEAFVLCTGDMIEVLEEQILGIVDEKEN